MVVAVADAVEALVYFGMDQSVEASQEVLVSSDILPGVQPWP